MPRSSFLKPVNYGTVFQTETGKLYYFHPEENIQVMRAWPKPQAWQLTPEKGWLGFHPRLEVPRGSLEQRLAGIAERLGLPTKLLDGHPPMLPVLTNPKDLPSLLREQARLRWLSTIPEEVRRAIMVFPKHQWHLLRLVATAGSPALDLIRATPALAIALACAPRFRPISRPLRAWRTLLGPGRTQAEIAAWLGFTTIRLLRKAHKKCYSYATLLYLRQIDTEPRLRKRAAHLECMTRTCVFLLSSPKLEPLVGQRLLHEAAEDPSLRVSHYLLDIVRMLDVLQPEGWQLHPFESSSRIRDLHDELAGKMQAIELANHPMPSSPFPGTDTIVPITSTKELAEEGRNQKNCVASYLLDILGGKKFIYRVLAPERATLSLRARGPENKRWGIDQLLLARNKEPSEETFRAVKSWFEASVDAEVPTADQQGWDDEAEEDFVI